MPTLNGKFYPYKKYAPGDKITSLDDLAKQERIFWHDTLFHRGWFKSWQFRMAEDAIQSGMIRYAVKKEGNNG